jgi:O-6-methylguanine DNA methyltransferase
MKRSSLKQATHRISFGKRPPDIARFGFCSYQDIPLAVALTADGAVCRVDFVKGKPSKDVMPQKWKKWKNTRFTYDPKAIEPVAKKISSGSALDLEIIGTDFQCAVWRNLLAIPHGETLTYGEVAKRSKRPKAVRAVGTACGANPVAILVPCHRVIAGDGTLGGFGGGLPTKIRLLQTEGVTSKQKKKPQK